MRLQYLLVITLSTLTIASDFVQSCRDLAFAAPSMLSASCAGPSGWTVSQLDLNLCFGIADDQFVPQESGDAFMECYSAEFGDQGAELLVSCVVGERNTYGMKAAINEVISNYNGVLNCFDHDGTII
ncbi:hypothetical protein BDV39DRAFT_211052 [Aspergillus sergii]|uniref:Cyanovirin-N domain-containing protein n=1 Tax=Aspergillus sergii TaxID=1034303 RepID=A0A5N6WJM9_9EURO|nr:hypothetical protein BDV39DRAFT_211052 [Aspergillus sergii]